MYSYTYKYQYQYEYKYKYYYKYNYVGGLLKVVSWSDEAPEAFLNGKQAEGPPDDMPTEYSP